MLCLTGLFIWHVSDILLSPPPRPPLTLPTAWPGSDHAEMDQGHFSPGESTLTAPLTTQANSKHMEQVWTYYPDFDKNNNWLICTCMAGWSQVTVGEISMKTNLVDTDVKYMWWIYFATLHVNVLVLWKLFDHSRNLPSQEKALQTPKPLCEARGPCVWGRPGLITSPGHQQIRLRSH